ncbi:MAG: hypothetical protein HRU20_19045 [Pseudomonadales bacterium]|nr:hypothetical protein [Pseudomonadales bacterium]
MKNTSCMLVATILALSVVFQGCSDDGDTIPPEGDGSITPEYVRDVLQNGLDIPFSTFDTKIVHRDGFDGAKVDIDVVIVSSAENPETGELLAFAFDGVMLESTPEGTVAALYMDTEDGGFEIAGIEANYLLLNANKGDNLTPDFALYSYDGSNWNTHIFHESHGRFDFDESGFKAVAVPDTADADMILGKQGVKAVLALQAFENRDVNGEAITTDITGVFTMDIPKR